ncbi:Germinal-center associated nuclear protein [Clonorchis sinensis]|nr:Germinal-center associated nuclear protein [Clonorchis sinensis]
MYSRFLKPTSFKELQMFGSDNQTEHNLFAGIKSASNAGLFRVTDTVSSDKTGVLFSGSSFPSTGLFGLTVSCSPKQTSILTNESPPGHPLDIDAPSSKTLSPQPSNRSPTHWPAIKLSRLPIGFNRKSWLQQYFERFGTVTRVLCQPTLDAAYVAFETVTAAQRAKRHGHDTVADGETLPTSVLLTMAQCRSRSNTGPSTGTGQPLQSASRHKPSPVQPNLPREQHLKTIENFGGTGATAVRLDSSGEREVVPPPEVGPLRNLFGSTVEERLSILQAHYQMQRQQRPAQVAFQPFEFGPLDSSMSEDALDPRAATIRGTCMDMCPELERYFREFHHRVSVFECLSSTLAAPSSWQMDHTRAVKDYERSSADQPVPLPCELRPAPVLRRTMAYLLASIADRPELDNTRSLWKPWYEFMWTRTRAIRKDIVQQRLCCPVIVGVMERIARFHIFCAARLVDQPIDSFDPRINSENLTQCLQTLKEMYSDLDADTGDQSNCFCPNEAEFRAYMLLMNLNDQGALNDVQKLPSHLLRSPEMRFAVSVHESVTTNNYIRFFRLVHQATFLSACLMHRYFVQVRSQALIRLAASFAGHPRKDVQYPLSTLTRQLGFEDTQEAKSFCECWGLTVYVNQLVFEKQTPPQPPELAWRERRSLRLIEQKRSSIPLSTVFNGGPVCRDDAVPPPVHSSFDNENRFVGKDELEEPNRSQPSTVSYSVPMPAFIPAEPPNLPPVDRKPQNPYMKELLGNKPLVMNFIDQWVDEFLDFRGVARQVLVEESVLRTVLMELIECTVRQEVHKMATETLNTQHQTVQERTSTELRDSLLESVLITECQRIAQHCLALASLCRDMLEFEFLPILTETVIRNCWLSTKADHFRRRHLLQACFHRFHLCMHQKQCAEREHALFQSMPACPPPHLNALSLVGPKVLTGTVMNSPDSQRWHDASSKRPRFSSWAQQMDDKITWQPVPLAPQLIGCSLGLYSPMSAARLRKALSVITAWLRIKLSNCRLISVPNLIGCSPDTSKLTGLLCLGSPDELVLRCSTQNKLPVLVFIPKDMTSDEKDGKYFTPDASLVYAVSFSWTGMDQFVPNQSWSVVLQDGLDWLASNILPKSIATQLSPRRSRSDRLSNQIRLVDIIWHLVDRLFFHPLSTLSQTWKEKGLVAPCPSSVFHLYRVAVDRICSRLNTTQLSITVQSDLHIPTESVQLLTDSHTWDQFLQNWSAFSEQLHLSPYTYFWVQTAISHVEKSFHASAGLLDLAPLPVLAPWLTLCMATVRDRLEQLEHSDVADQPAELVSIENLLELLCETEDQEILAEFTSHFSTLGEPCTTYVSAVDLSLANSSQHQIAIRLRGSTRTSPANPTSRSLLLKLDSLRHRMDTFEESMQEVLEQTGVSSKLSLTNTCTTFSRVSKL